MDDCSSGSVYAWVEQVNLDAEVAKAKARLHRQIGQWARRDDKRRAQHVQIHLDEIEYAFARIKYPPRRKVSAQFGELYSVLNDCDGPTDVYVGYWS